MTGPSTTPTLGASRTDRGVGVAEGEPVARPDNVPSGDALSGDVLRVALPDYLLIVTGTIATVPLGCAVTRR